MNKTETLALLIPQMEGLLAPLGFRYLKSQEKFSLTEHGDKKGIGINVTYWSSSDYTMFTPILGIHYKRIEKYKEEHLGQKYDSHMSTFHLRGDNIPEIRFWSFDSMSNFEEQTNEIEEKMRLYALPLLDKISSIEEIVSMVIKREYDNFMNEYDRLISLLSLAGAYERKELVSPILESFDPSLKSKNQLIPHHRELLSKLTGVQPRLLEILETNKV